MTNKPAPKLVEATPPEDAEATPIIKSEDTEATPIIKPDKFSLEEFESSSDATIGGVDTELPALPYYRMCDANDYVRLHHDAKYWSAPLCFVSVPIKGEKGDTLHLIGEALTKRLLSSGRIKRCRLVLAAKPDDIFFLCQVPCTNLDNDWNKSNLAGCEKAKTIWTQAISMKKEGIEGYKNEGCA